jgi:hypothetical protein
MPRRQRHRAWDHRFIVHVGEVTAQASDFLHQATLRRGHEFPIALIPELVTVSDCPGDTAAIGLDRVFCYQFGVERRQLAMPIHDLWSALVIRSERSSRSVECSHEDINASAIPPDFCARCLPGCQ